MDKVTAAAVRRLMTSAAVDRPPIALVEALRRRNRRPRPLRLLLPPQPLLRLPWTRAPSLR